MADSKIGGQGAAAGLGALAGATPWGAAFGAGAEVLSAAVTAAPAGPSNAAGSPVTVGGINFAPSGSSQLIMLAVVAVAVILAIKVLK